MRPLDRTAMAKRYKGKWVALKADRKTVIASGKNVADVLRLAQDKGVKMPIITRMPRLPMRFIGYQNKAMTFSDMNLDSSVQRTLLFR